MQKPFPFLLLVGWLVACGVAPSAKPQPMPEAASRPAEAATIVAPTDPPSPTLLPTTTKVPMTETPMPTHIPPKATAMPAPTVAALGAQAIIIEVADGGQILGEVLGSGTTAVVFSVMGSCKPGWTDLAQDVAAQGFFVLTYRWRACHANRIDNREIRLFVDDTRAAIQYVRDHGAQRVILVGASLGGCASAKLLAESRADGLVVVAAPPAIPDWGFRVDADDLQSAAPKLFITSEDDPTVPADATRELYDLAAKPRAWQTYPGTAHGTDIFEGDHGAALKQRIMDFLIEVKQG